jgi:hypothetical protein
MKLTRAFLLFLVIAPSLWARLGETEAELVARFGQPHSRVSHSVFAQGKFIPLGPQLHFREGEWRITADLIDGRCLRIAYQKPGDWTEDQIRLVLNSNTQSSQWAETSKANIAKLQRAWRRKDGSVAEWDKLTGFTLTWAAYETAKAKALERARVEASRKPKI